MMAWFRFYDEVLDDPKVQRLPPRAFKHWVNILCLAKRTDGVLPAIPDIAFALRIDEEKTQALVNTLIENKLLDNGTDGIVPHNWCGRQYKSDVSTDRVKRFRKRSKAPQGTPPETETETETERKREAVAKNADPTPDLPPIPESLKRGTRLSLDNLPDDWREFCRIARPGLDPERTWAIFQDHWRAKAGQGGVKLDWQATWRNWVRREGNGNGINRRADGSGGKTTKDERAKAAVLRGLAVKLPGSSQ